MTPEQWLVIGDIYRGALERNVAARASFIAGACDGNVLLQSEVESLLAAEQAAGDFLQANAAPRIESPSLAGGKLRQYQLLSPIGSGGMGEVYRAFDTSLKRDAAIKILPAALATDVGRLRRFEQEAQAASSLNHPNIVTIYETGEADAGRFLAMEMVEGETLRSVIETRPPVERVIRICLQAARALNAAHAAGIVHRDIKPENLMLRPDGYVKVLDFGLARLLPPAGITLEPPASAITQPGMTIGTIGYMSPEQARGEPVTSATDIFSLGLVMYELATVRHPFRAGTEFGTLDAILSQPPLPPSHMNPAIPAALELLILRMLDKEAPARPSAAEVEQSLAELADALKPGANQVFRSSRRSVGRAREHGQLNAYWDSAHAGRGLVCCVSGEPGIGKTTLVEDFLSALAANDRQCITARGRCSERLAGTDAYSPFLEALDGMRRTSGSVAESMKRLAPTWFSQIASHLSMGEAADPLRLERAYSQERIERELGSFLSELSRRQTVLLFLEDLQWADLSTVDLLAFLADRIANLRLLIVITYRPSDLQLAKQPSGGTRAQQARCRAPRRKDRRGASLSGGAQPGPVRFLRLKQDLQARGVAHEIKLGFLSPGEVAQYIALQFPEHRLPSAVAEMIHAKTEGSPLFMTDLLRYLRDRQIIAPESGAWILAQPLPDIERDLPESMRAMIERMVERLDQDDSRLLVAASVQGHEFDSAVLSRALGRDDASVEERLQVLERVHQFAALVEERELPAGTLTLRYRFIHVLYQNALYATLPPARRAALSNAVAESLLALHGDRNSAVAADLARLFEAGRRFLLAAEHYLTAARNASRIFAANEAAALAKRGLSIIQSAPPAPQRNEIEFSLQLVLGNALLVVLGYGAPEVQELYARAHELCRRAGEPGQLLPILYGLWIPHLIHGKIELALKYAEDFLELARQIHSPAALVGERMVGCPHFYLGNLTQARPYFERAVSLYEPSLHRSMAWLYGQEPGMTAHSYLSWIMWLLGYPDRGAEHNRESLRLSRELEHSLSRGHALYFSAVHAHLRRDWGTLRQLADELVLVGRERKLAFWYPAGRILRGLMMTKEGDASGIGEMQEGIDSLTSAGTELCLSAIYRFFAEGFRGLQQPAEALSAIEAGLAVTQKIGERFFEPELHRFHGELLLWQAHAGAQAKAEACFERALNIARQQNAKSWELRASTSLGRLLANRGDRLQALELLTPVCGWFTEGRDTPDLQDAHALLGELGRRESGCYTLTGNAD